ncbi:Hypothetical predicted protein [Mytilus galloprovincialis]|uniref:Uncharacterized protein n=1 Tax=Mytilus galloprovincialis TaxID=29158 RepID=A0A8B6HAQ4_MYTGA|nr:Hypothetical predicted protein [Mytilus galloprovincialis]
MLINVQEGPNSDEGLNGDEGPNSEEGTNGDEDPNSDEGTNGDEGPNSDAGPNSDEGSNGDKGPNISIVEGNFFINVQHIFPCELRIESIYVFNILLLQQCTNTEK